MRRVIFVVILVLLLFLLFPRQSPSTPPVLRECIRAVTVFEENRELPRVIVGPTLPSPPYPLVLATMPLGADIELYIKMIKEDGFFEGVFVAFFDILSSAPPAPLVLDVGGNFGLMSALSAQLGANVVAFEANPATARYFALNMRMNCVPLHQTYAANGDVLDDEQLLQRRAHVTLVNSGVGDTSNSSFALKGSGPWSGSMHVSTTEPGTIPVRRIDDLLAVRRRVYLMKLDVEGAEERAIRGAQRLFERRETRPFYVIYEWDPRLLGARGGALVVHLAALDYELFVLGGRDEGARSSVELARFRAYRTRPIDPARPTTWPRRAIDVIAVSRELRS